MLPRPRNGQHQALHGLNDGGLMNECELAPHTGRSAAGHSGIDLLVKGKRVCKRTTLQHCMEGVLGCVGLLEVPLALV